MRREGNTRFDTPELRPSAIKVNALRFYYAKLALTLQQPMEETVSIIASIIQLGFLDVLASQHGYPVLGLWGAIGN